MNALRDAYEAESLADLYKQESLAKRTALHADEISEFRLPIKRKAALGKARDIASDAIRIATGGDDADQRKGKLLTLCQTMGVKYPASDYGQGCEIARLSAVEWWGKRLRVTDWRSFEARKIRLGQIGDTQHYCSDEIASAYIKHQGDIQKLLEGMIAYREDGEAAFTLLELMRKSKSEPAVRFAAMIHQAKGMTNVAVNSGMTWAFWTLTCPSKFHRMTTIGKGKGTRRVPNPKWQGTMPRDGQEYLTNVWAKVRAKIKREKIDSMFMRVAEPHTDGCPHWHGIFWAKKDDLKRIKAILREYSLLPVSTAGLHDAHVIKWETENEIVEPGAWRHRMRWLNYRPWAAKNVDGEDAKQREINACIGYMVAYIGKNIHGKRVDDSSMGTTTDRARNVLPGDAVDNAVRAVAWASLWGIRQFQFGGCAKSGPYEELRRLREEIPDPELEEARKCADQGDFAGYCEMAGQLELKLWQETSAERITALAAAKGMELAATPELAAAVVDAELLNKWGEPTRRWVIGVRAGSNDFQRKKTRLHVWKIAPLSEIAALAEGMGDAGRRLLDVLRERTDAIQRAAGEAVAAVLSALDFSRAAQPRALGPGSITVRGQPVGNWPPDDDGGGGWYFTNAYGIEQGAF